MYSVILTLIVIASVLMCIVVLMQEAKGGGLASSFSGYNQIMGVRKTTDFIEKVTWILAITMVALAIVSTLWLPSSKAESESDSIGTTNLEEMIQDQQGDAAEGQPAPDANI